MSRSQRNDRIGLPITLEVKERKFDHELPANAFMVGHDECAGRPDARLEGNTLILKPSYYDPETQNATVQLRAEQFKVFLSGGNLNIFSGADEGSSKMPRHSQRVPTATRKRKIIESWNDPIITPEGKVENIQVAVYGARVTSRGIELDRDAIVSVTDGGGRASASCEILNEADNPLVSRKITFQISIDLSGKQSREQLGFLHRNYFGKRVTSGTLVGVHASLVSNLQDEMPEWEIPVDDKCLDNPLFRAKMLDNLYQREKGGTLLSLFPWRFEGKRSHSPDFERTNGQHAAIATALKDVYHLCRTYLNVSRFKDFDTLADAIYDGMREIYDACEDSVHFASLAPGNDDTNVTRKGRLCSTLGMKVVLLFILKFSGRDQRIVDLCDAALDFHYLHHKDKYLNKQQKTMYLDRFFQESLWFADDSFNSGAANSQKIIRELDLCCRHVLGEAVKN